MAYKTPSTEEDHDLAADIRKKWKEAKEGHAEWRQEARESFGFVAGDQWTQEDIAKLNEEGRPPITFNRIGAMVDAVSGLEINSRQSVRYFPREMGDVRVNEILTAAAKWIRDQSNVEDEDSEAFRDAAISGVGVTETLMDYESDKDGKVCVVRRDPLMVFPDPSAHKRGFLDAQYVFHAEWMDKKDVSEKWDKEIAWSDDDLGYQTPGDGDRSFEYDGDAEKQEFTKDKALVLHYQCCKREPFYRTVDPFTQEEKEFSEEEFEDIRKKAKKLGISFAEAGKGDPGAIPYVKQRKKVYYRAFMVGGTVLEWSRSPSQTGFTFKFITGKRDRNKQCFYGIVRALKDPQRWANKWLSQILHIINTNAKGGAFVEENALTDIRKARDEWASPSPLILLKEGGIGKIKERTPAAYPNGLDRLMMFAFESFPFISGIPLEAMGLANREQAGILEAQRRKAAMAILAPLFESLREYRKGQGEILLEFIGKFFPEGKLIRITGNEGDVQFVPFVKQPETAVFDVVIDQSSDSPDFRDRAWEALTELLPPLMKQGVPIPAEALKYAPIPSEVAQVLEKAMTQSLPPPPELLEQMKQLEAAVQKFGQENEKLREENVQLKIGAQVDILKMQQRAQSDQAKISQKMQATVVDAMAERAKAIIAARVDTIEASIKADAEERKALLEAMKIRMDAEAKERKTLVDSVTKIKVEAIKAATKAAEDKVSEKPAKPRKRKIKTPRGDVYEMTEE